MLLQHFSLDAVLVNWALISDQLLCLIKVLICSIMISSLVRQICQPKICIKVSRFISDDLLIYALGLTVLKLAFIPVSKIEVGSDPHCEQSIVLFTRLW
jgi:hypothetical protein